ncbi:MAG: hypothetical protein R3C12_01035 [Planctomycetaceae bacterium]
MSTSRFPMSGESWAIRGVDYRLPVALDVGKGSRWPRQARQDEPANL